MGKSWAVFVSVVLAVAILSPLHEDFRGVRGDSFPLSWYPMFSRPRPDPERSNYLVGILPDGSRHIIKSYYYVTGGMNLARRKLATLVRTRKTSRELCKKAARAIAKRKTGKSSRVVRIRVVRGYFHMKKYFGERDKTPVREKVFASCRVDRSPLATSEKKVRKSK